MAATGQTSVEAVTIKPSGTDETASRWLIHTVCLSGVRSKILLREPASLSDRRAGPYSPFSVCPTTPPNVAAMI